MKAKGTDLFINRSVAFYQSFIREEMTGLFGGKYTRSNPVFIRTCGYAVWVAKAFSIPA